MVSVTSVGETETVSGVRTGRYRTLSTSTPSKWSETSSNVTGVATNYQYSPRQMTDDDSFHRDLDRLLREKEDEIKRMQRMHRGDLTTEEKLIYRCKRSGDECWRWKGSTSRNQPRITLDGQTRQARRAAYKEWVGEIPENTYVTTECENPLCINPDHLRTANE